MAKGLAGSVLAEARRGGGSRNGEPLKRFAPRPPRYATTAGGARKNLRGLDRSPHQPQNETRPDKRKRR
jgi:hypothetical protein